jgi:chemotaxis protein MotA
MTGEGRRAPTGGFTVRSAIVIGVLLVAADFWAAAVVRSGAAGPALAEGAVLFTGCAAIAAAALWTVRRLGAPIRWVRLATDAAARVRSVQPADPIAQIHDLVGYATVARKQGLVAAEGLARAGADPFLARAFRLACEGARPEELRGILRSEADAPAAGSSPHAFSPHRLLIEFLAPLATIGLLLVCILLFAGQIGDPVRGATGWAVFAFASCIAALLVATAVNGVGVAAAHPAAAILARMLVIEAVAAIRAGDSAPEVERKLLAFLPPSIQESRLARAA